MLTALSACRNEADLLVPAASARQTVELVNAIMGAAIKERAVHLPLDPVAYDALWADLVAGNAHIPSCPCRQGRRQGAYRRHSNRSACARLSLLVAGFTQLFRVRVCPE
ncbi:MAG: hypothetical protein KF832_16245 [Caldilineaceae bacterium]|nr:hypothetical protein [Caldilineaceae bacterium]